MLIRNLYVRNAEAKQLQDRSQAYRALMGGIALIVFGVFVIAAADSIGLMGYFGMLPMIGGFRLVTNAEAKLRMLETIWINPNWNPPEEDSLG
ncbi:hypothetical protein KJ910_03545 [Patescibacteria group bacterium]|nr:hypothetical protein [Patescibacteria group bacterium]MBU1907160.1 hypothetical protein [Patescibacteria group bacterium]